MGILSMFEGVKFYNSVINNYIESRMKGLSRFESNYKELSIRLTGKPNYSFSNDANNLISSFDILDTVQFLQFFNDNISLKLSLVPKKRSGVRRSELARILLPKQFNYLHNNNELRENFRDLIDEFKVLTKILKNDLNIY